MDFPMRSPTSTLKSTVSAFDGAVPRIAKRANAPFGIIPPDHVTACPVRDDVQLGFASTSSRSKSCGMPSVTWSMPTASPTFGTEKTRSTRAPVCTLAGLIERGAPAADASASAVTAVSARTRSRGLEPKVPRYHHALNLIRSLADLQDLLVAVQARDGVLVHETVAAVDLEAPVCGAVRELAGEELRHRGGATEVAPLVLLPRRLVDERARRFDLGRHVDELLLHGLELRDRLAELLALLRVPVREVVGALREADAHRRDGDATAVEDLQELLEPLAARPEQVALRDARALKAELARVRGAPAELLHRLRDRVAGRSVRDDDVGDLVVAGAGGDRHARRDVGAGVGDEHLRAVDDPFAAVELRGRPRRARVRAGIRLRQPERGEPAARGELGEPVALLLLAPEVVDRQRAERVVSRDGDRDGGVDSRQLLDHDRVRERVRACAAVLLRDRHPHQPELGELGHDLVREAVLPVELLGDGLDLLQREAAHRVAEQLMLVLEIEVQAASRCASSTIRRTP